MTAVLSEAPVCSCCGAGPVDVAAAFALADAWGPALSRSFHRGYEQGLREGWIAGRDEERTAWNRIMGVYRDAIKRPALARRGETR